MGDKDIQVPFVCPRLEANASELAALGIEINEPEGATQSRSGSTELGMILVSGHRIVVIPHEGLDAVQASLLLGAAEVAFHRPPSKPDGWVHHAGNDPRWTAWVTVGDSAFPLPKTRACAGQGRWIPSTCRVA